MSHRWDCPTDYEARRRGEDMFNRGYGSYSNPYRDSFGEEHCPEAEQNWQRGYRDAERRDEERREEERIIEMQREHRRQEEARYNEAMEAQYYEQQMAEQEQQPEETQEENS